MDKQTAKKLLTWWDSLSRGQHPVSEAEAWLERARPLIEEARKVVETETK